MAQVISLDTTTVMALDRGRLIRTAQIETQEVSYGFHQPMIIKICHIRAEQIVMRCIDCEQEEFPSAEPFIDRLKGFPWSNAMGEMYGDGIPGEGEGDGHSLQEYETKYRHMRGRNGWN